MTNRLFDKFGNELYVENGKVFLRLKESKRVRFLGYIKGDTFYTFRKRMHRFECMDAIGFNWHLMKYGKFRNVEIELETGDVMHITREHILEHGSTKMFKSQGYELQIFVPITVFNQTKSEVAI